MQHHLFILLVVTGVVPMVYTVYRRFYLILQPVTWDTAQTNCRATYTDLATVEYPYEADQIQNLALSQNLAASVWIGLYNDFYNWRWSMADEPLGVYRMWYPTNPDNYLAGEYCCLIDLIGWFDNSCTELLPFICFDGRYTGASSYVYISTPKTWFNARSYCRQQHTDLVSVKSSAENTAVRAKILGRTWFGLYRDSWKWSDGTNFTTIDWATGEPNNSLSNENCVFYASKKAGDVKCSRLKPYVCHNVIKGRKQIARIKVQSNHDVNDPAVMAPILDQMQTILSGHGNITVKWRNQPNGDVFNEQKNLHFLNVSYSGCWNLI